MSCKNVQLAPTPIKSKGASLKIFNAVLLSILLTACTTTRQAHLPTEGYGMDGVNEGDKVRIVMNDGTKHTIIVTQVNEIGLHGSHDSFVYSDMQSLVVIEKRFNAKHVSWVIFGLAIIAVAVLGAGYSGTGGPLCLYASNDPNRTCL